MSKSSRIAKVMSWSAFASSSIVFAVAAQEVITNNPNSGYSICGTACINYVDVLGGGNEYRWLRCVDCCQHQWTDTNGDGVDDPLFPIVDRCGTRDDIQTCMNNCEDFWVAPPM